MDPGSQSEEKQIEMIKKNIHNIQYIKEPSERIQLIAVNKSPRSLRWIKNATPKVIEKALELDSGAIRYVKNPTRQQIISAVEHNWQAIQYLKGLPVDILKKGIPSYIKWYNSSMWSYKVDEMEKVMTKEQKKKRRARRL